MHMCVNMCVHVCTPALRCCSAGSPSSLVRQPLTVAALTSEKERELSLLSCHGADGTSGSETLGLLLDEQDRNRSEAQREDVWTEAQTLSRSEDC